MTQEKICMLIAMGVYMVAVLVIGQAKQDGGRFLSGRPEAESPGDGHERRGFGHE